MKLYYARGSSSLLPHIVLYEAGLPFSAVEVDEHSKVIEGGGDYRKHEYLMGYDYSVADAHLFVVSNWASWVNFDLSPYANVVSLRTRVGARVAVRSAMEAERLIPWPNSPP